MQLKQGQIKSQNEQTAGADQGSFSTLQNLLGIFSRKRAQKFSLKILRNTRLREAAAKGALLLANSLLNAPHGLLMDAF